MSVPPKIDNRTYNDIVEQTVEFAEQFSAWRQGDTKADAGGALIRIFGRMATLAIDRLNRVPEKNFLAFLDLIGTQLQPPQPARVPLTFALAQGSPGDAFVPAGTLVAAPQTEGQAQEVVFETERDLVVTAAQLKAAIVRQPNKNQSNRDYYSDYTLLATGEQNLVFPAFEAETEIEHFLYLACDNLTSLPGKKAVTLTFNSAQAAKLQQLFSEWRYWNGKTWEPLNPTSALPSGSLAVTIASLPAIQPQTVNTTEARWLRVSLDGSQQEMTALPKIDRIQASVRVSETQLAPNSCLFNTSEIDPSKDFYPFGEQPRFNDTFYIAHDKALSQPKATVTIAITLSDGIPVRTDGGVQLAWETWNGSSWQVLPPSSDSNSAASRFIGSGNVKLTLPNTVAPAEINGESHYWLRVRILSGNYGTSAAANQSAVFATLSEAAQASQNRLKVSSVRGFMPGDAMQIFASTPVNASVSSIEFATNTLILAANLTAAQTAGTLVQVTSTSSGIQPPSVKSLMLAYTYSSTPSLATCLTYNDFIYQVQSPSTSFTPFVRNLNPHPALYLGFDRPFANRSIALYLQVEPPQPEEVEIGTQNLTPQPPPARANPQLVWEYASNNTSDWARLGVEDETQAFADRGLIRFIAPPDLAKRAEFGVEFYWLRVRWEAGEFRVKPRLRRVLTNTIWASQTHAIAGELLGSGNGNPQQIVRTAQVPILLGQRLEVREREMPSPEEQAAIEQQEGKDALTVVLAGEEDSQDIEAVWVRWHEVTDFYESGPRDRHYTVDRLTGAIYFGDGQNGAMPPQGRNNIRLSYRTGGGQYGNLPDRTVTQLKTTVPYVDGVTNLQAAGGGSDRESISRVQERGPKILRHGGKAVTVQDFEDLAYEASTEVARVKAIVPEFDPLDPNLWIDPSAANPNLSEHQKVSVGDRGKVTLLIVPYSAAAQPTPSLALIDRVRDYIQARCSPTVDLRVAAPQWQQVSVTAELVPTSLDVADAVRIAAQSRLEQFLHPLTGGAEGRGWAFGRTPHLSDIYALLESISGLDRIRSLQIGDGRSETPNKSSRNDRFLVYSGRHELIVNS